MEESEGVPIKTIAGMLGVAWNTVRQAVRDTGPPKYERPAVPSVVDAVETQIRVLLKEIPTMPTTLQAPRHKWL